MEKLMEVPYNAAVRTALASLERNLLPELVVRRLTRLRLGFLPSAHLQLSNLIQIKQSLEDIPISVETDKAKTQHYELPTSFFKLVLGKNLKCGCCYFSDKPHTLENAENAMLELYCERAQVKDGQSILDVGCGWVSL